VTALHGLAKLEAEQAKLDREVTERRRRLPWVRTEKEFPSGSALLAEADPDHVVAAGAEPHLAPIDEQTWETSSRTWNVDVRITLEVGRAALARPLQPSSTVVIVSRALGSPARCCRAATRGPSGADVPCEGDVLPPRPARDHLGRRRAASPAEQPPEGVARVPLAEGFRRVGDREQRQAHAFGLALVRGLLRDL
jgi:hypothetical protein